MYGVWAFLFFHALSFSRTLKKSLWITILVAALTGIILECAQYLMRQGRSFEFADMLANALGAIIGGWTGLFLVNFRRKK
jgi:glycopeptide antibiotics resistance protein